jgi:hypothetical protein
VSKTLYVGDLCVYCWHSTAMGSGKFVNRISANRTASDAEEDFQAGVPVPQELAQENLSEYDYVDGHMCAECYAYECDACGKPVFEDNEVWDTDETGHWHSECLPESDWHPDLR